MKKKKILLIIMLFTSISLSCIAYYYHVSVKVDNKRYLQLSTKQKLVDFDYAYDILKDNFPYFEIEKEKTGFDWLEHKQKFEDEIKHTNNDIEFYNKMSEILKSVQNGHTYLEYPFDNANLVQVFSYAPVWENVLNNSKVQEKNKYWTKLLKNECKAYRVPVDITYVEGKYVVYNNSFGIPEGSFLRKVNNIDIDKYVKGLTNKQYIYYDDKRKKPYVENLRLIGNKDEDILITLESPEGKVIIKKLKTQLYNYYDKITTQSVDNDVVSTKILDKNKTAYIKVASMAVDDQSYYSKLYDFYEEIKDYPNLIIDIRGNGGGSDLFWERNIITLLEKSNLTSRCYMLFRNGKYIKPFIEQKVKLASGQFNILPIKDMPYSNKLADEFKNDFTSFISIDYSFKQINTIGFKGKVYLLVDRNVYSAAEGFAIFAKDTKFATLIGTTTGGDGVGFDPAIARLPNSGLLFSFPMSYGLNPDGTANEETQTKPDVFVEQTYSDFLKTQEWMKTNNINNINPYDTILNKTLEIIKAVK